jgi:EAL domain-containing protein (putative c-di-GMP-specific phosphodiesterase class I)
VTEALRSIQGESIEARPATENVAARLGWVGAHLEEMGAAAVILIEASALAEIERGYGVDAHATACDKLRRLAGEVCASDLTDADLLTWADGRGDQLVVVMFRPRADHLFYREGVPAIVERLIERIDEAGQSVVYPYRREAPSLSVGQSIVFHNPGLGPGRQIDMAIREAAGDAALSAHIDRRARRRAFVDLILAEEVSVLYEPIVNTTTREIAGYEALVRGPWEGPLHSPAALFGMAEETGLVFELDCLCRRAALRGAKGLPPGKLLFLNCLPTSIHDPAFRGDVMRQTLEELRLRPSDVVFEISEKESIDNFSIFREMRDRHAELGFRIALDDTGVAYGSLEAIMELAPDFIKVDLSLVRGIDTDPPRQELLRSLHAVAVKLGAQIIAEGIETSEELAALHAIGVPLGQGYLFGRPAPLRRSV